MNTNKNVKVTTTLTGLMLFIPSYYTYPLIYITMSVSVKASGYFPPESSGKLN